MLLKLLIIGSVGFACALAEAPLQQQQHRQRSGPYPAAGWRPRKPFNLPGEYLPPGNEFESQQQHQQQPADIEVTKQRVDFIGQSPGGSATALNQPQTAYLPADEQDEVNFPRTQGLPVEGRYPVFNRDHTQFQTRPQGGGALNQQRRPHQKYQPAEQPNQSFVPQQQQQRPQSFPTQQQQFFPSQPKPAQQYGAPFTTPNKAFPDPRHTQGDNNDFAADAEEPKDDLKSFENENYDDSQQEQQQQQQPDDDSDNNEDYRSNGPPATSTKGQYYIVGPDNSIQRVMFTTTQDVEADGRSGNGFTAQLKYSPAGEVKDPIYRYNNRGQLVRVVK